MFADIALTEHPAKNDELTLIKPLSLDKHYFKPTDQLADAVVELTYPEKLEKFQEALCSLRRKYTPFMQNFVPDPKQNRKTIEITEFRFRYKTEQDNNFINVLNGYGDWQSVTIPDYRGPAGEDGKWTGFYRTEFDFSKTQGKRVYLVFKGVDYIANVYVNKKFVGTHEGFFAPFEFDITDILQERNELVVEVKNDYPTLGVQEKPILDGDKLYAATGPGWDDPNVGWHHCPPGAGIYNSVYIEERSEIFVQDIFVRPDIDDNFIEIWVDVFSSNDDIVRDFFIDVLVYSRNADGEKKIDTRIDVPYAGPGINYYRYKIPFDDYLLWEPENPWLYTARVSIVNEDYVFDTKDRNFGMRKFHSDEVNEPKGTLYLNNRPIILRGANEMGHLQQCVMQKDFEQLFDDILIAKLANMNFYRVTQRPVQEEIYDYFDMLGMMHQCDFPLFGTLRRNQFYEAIKQVGEMERLIRSHPSSIIVTFINEPVAIRKHEDPNHKYNRRYREKAHRHLFRQELEYFFKAARKAVALENPDRVVKNVEGDYDPPTIEGMPDFHCYCMWYTNHAVPIGKLHKGYLATVKKGWKVSCGEYGTEGLDNYAVMQKYPQDWLPENEGDPWVPDKIVRAQTWSMHGDWFEEQDNIKDWIYYSQKHQAFAARLMTDAFRRHTGILISTAIHLLIDAWPSGWMKALVGVDRVPKPAYFAFQASLEPVRVNLRSDRWQVYCGESIEVESWLLNDTSKHYRDCKIVVTLRDDKNNYESFIHHCEVKGTSSCYAGTIRVNIPNDISDRGELYLDACLIDSKGQKLNYERMKLTVFQRKSLAANKTVAYLGADAYRLLYQLHIDAQDFSQLEYQADIIVVSSIEEYARNENQLLTQINNGANVVFIRDNNKPINIDIQGKIFSTKNINPIYFAAINRESRIMQQFRTEDFSYWYNVEQDMVDFIADSYIISDEIEPLIYTYHRKQANERKKRLPIVGTAKIGKGQVILCNLPIEGKIGYNPVLDRFVIKLLGE